jgi:hypothetical protein
MQIKNVEPIPPIVDEPAHAIILVLIDEDELEVLVSLSGQRGE